jgi:hypothetical protein
MGVGIFESKKRFLKIIMDSTEEEKSEEIDTELKENESQNVFRKKLHKNSLETINLLKNIK